MSFQSYHQFHLSLLINVVLRLASVRCSLSDVISGCCNYAVIQHTNQKADKWRNVRWTNFWWIKETFYKVNDRSLTYLFVFLRFPFRCYPILNGRYVCKRWRGLFDWKKKKKRKKFCVLHCLLFSYSKAPLCTNVSKWLDSFLSTTINYHSGGLVIGNTASNKLS